MMSTLSPSCRAATGKLKAPDLIEAMGMTNLEEIPIRAAHGVAAAQLPRIHGDPFDRGLFAQAKLEGLTFISADSAFEAVTEIKVLW